MLRDYAILLSDYICLNVLLLLRRVKFFVILASILHLITVGSWVLGRVCIKQGLGLIAPLATSLMEWWSRNWVTSTSFTDIVIQITRNILRKKIELMSSRRSIHQISWLCWVLSLMFLSWSTWSTQTLK